MKLNKIFSYLLVSITFFIFSCGGSSDEEIEEKATSISIAVNKTTTDIGESLIFTVEDNLRFSRTSQATIYFNNVSISGSVYTPTEGGNFAVYAKYEGLTSPTIYVKVNEAITLTSIILKSDQSEILLGGTVTLTIKGNEGSDLTNEATYFVNDTEISGNTYTSNSRGNDKITASYNSLNSNELNLLTGFKQKVLIEDYTGTWCGYCPRVAYGIELVEGEVDDAIPVAIHRGSTNSTSGSYDPYNYPASALEDFIGLSGYPTAKLNRILTWNYPEPSNVNQVKNLTETNGIPKVGSVGLSLNSTLTGNELEIIVNTKILKSLEGEKLVVYILENGLIYNQANYTDYYGGSSVINNFEHNHVLRQVPTDLFGLVINSTDLDSATNSYQKSFSVNLVSEIENKNNLDVVAFVIDTNGKVLNAQHSKVGVTKDFD